jgi:hypothetical protein
MKMPWEMPSDENAVHFKQRRGGRRVLVSIDDAGVSYQLRDVSGETIFRASHEQIDPEMSSYTEKNGWLLRLGVTWSVLGAACAVVDPGAGLSIPLVFTMFGAVCAVHYFWRKASFTILRTDRGKISILQGRWHDEIIRELNSRRVAALRAKFLQIDHDNHPKAEITKYTWLRMMGAITDVEHAQFKSFLQSAEGDNPPKAQPPTISLN